MTHPLVFTSETPISDLVDQAVERVQTLDLDVSNKGFGTWSHSRLKQLMNCPLQFLLKTVLKISYELSHVERENNDQQYLRFIGLAAHKVLEDMVVGVSFEDAILRQEEEFKPLMGEERWKEMYGLKDNLESFCYRLHRFDMQHSIRKLTCEQQLAVDAEWNAVNFHSKNAFFRGILDLSVHLENNDVALFDHKNGGSAKYGIRNYELQLKTQSLLFVAANREVKGTIPFIHFIQEGDVAGGRTYYPRDQVLNEFTKTLHSCIDGALENLKTSAKFRHRAGNYCNYCDFQPICRGGKRGTANLLEPVVEKSKVFFKS